MTVVLWLLVLALPKAGWFVDDVPVTIASVALMLYAAYHFLFVGHPARYVLESRRFTVVHLTYVWVMAVGLLVNLDDAGTTDFTMWMVLVASPLAFHAGLRTRHPERMLAVVLIATIVVGGYALLQNLIGVEETAVPGVTHVHGEDLIRNNPIRTPSGTLKSPSTFHNGNLAASFLLLGMGCAVYSLVKSGRSRILAVAALAAATVGLAVSLARAALFGIFVAGCFALLPANRPPWLGRRVASLMALSLVGVAGLLVAYAVTGAGSFLFERFVEDAINDPTGAGRTEGADAWLDGLRDLSAIDLLRAVVFGDGSIDPVSTKLEGVVTLVAKWGVPALVVLVALVLLPLRMMHERLGAHGTALSFGAMASASMWLLDNTLLFPPTLMNWFLIVGLMVQLGRRDEDAVLGEEIERFEAEFERALV